MIQINFFGMNKFIGGVLPPVADFTVNSVFCNTGEVLAFTDLSTETPTSWAWDFGDGNTSTFENPTHSYSTQGTYSVSMTASNADGSDGEAKTDYIQSIEWLGTSIIMGGMRDDGDVLRSNLLSGTFNWQSDPFSGSNINFAAIGVALNRFNEIYVGSRWYGTETYTFVKTNYDGDIIWGIDTNTFCYGAMVDNNDNPWVSIEGNIIKMDPSDGTILATGGSGSFTAYDMAGDMDGNIYTAIYNSSNNLQKFDNDANFLWEVSDHGGNLQSIAVPLSGTYVVAGGVRTSNITWRKWDSDGNLEYSKDTGSTFFYTGRNIFVDEGNDSIYVISENENLRKYSSAGTLLWSQTLSCSWCRAFFVMGDGTHIYTGDQAYGYRRYTDAYPLVAAGGYDAGAMFTIWFGAIWPLPYGRNNIT
jgi:PKD repeat protein